MCDLCDPQQLQLCLRCYIARTMEGRAVEKGKGKAVTHAVEKGKTGKVEKGKKGAVNPIEEKGKTGKARDIEELEKGNDKGKNEQGKNAVTKKGNEHAVNTDSSSDEELSWMLYYARKRGRH